MGVMRWSLLGLLSLGLAGTGTELMLFQHYEDGWQIVPLALVGLTILVIVWHLFARSAHSVRALQMLMVMLVVAGGLGLVLHYRGNVEFQLETDPSMHGWPLFMKALHAKAPPALAPGSMAQLGLLGLVYAYRHPALTGRTEKPSMTTGA